MVLVCIALVDSNPRVIQQKAEEYDLEKLLTQL